MATNFRQDGRTLALTAPAGGLKSGQGHVFGSLFGIAALDAAAGASVEAHVEGVFALPMPSTVIAFAEGARVFWDVSAGNVTTVASTNFPIGAAIAAAGVGSATVLVKLDGIATSAVPIA
jgi:predicted RecA/RadA family phage recombinase